METSDTLADYVRALQEQLEQDGLTLVRIRTKEELRRWLKMKRL
jgi:hypothetical protein